MTSVSVKAPIFEKFFFLYVIVFFPEIWYLGGDSDNMVAAWTEFLPARAGRGYDLAAQRAVGAPRTGWVCYSSRHQISRAPFFPGGAAGPF